METNLIVTAVAVSAEAEEQDCHPLVPSLGSVHEGRHAVPSGAVHVRPVVR